MMTPDYQHPWWSLMTPAVSSVLGRDWFIWPVTYNKINVHYFWDKVLKDAVTSFSVTIFSFSWNICSVENHIVSSPWRCSHGEEVKTKYSCQQPHEGALSVSSTSTLVWDYNSQQLDWNFLKTLSQNCSAKVLPDYWPSEMGWNNSFLLRAHIWWYFCITMNNEYAKEEWSEMMWCRTSQTLAEFELSY